MERGRGEDVEGSKRLVSRLAAGLGILTLALILWRAITHWLVPIPVIPAMNVAIHLFGREEYHCTFESDTTINLWSSRDSLNKTLGMYASFIVTQAGKDGVSTRMRFRLNSLRLRQTGRIEEITDPSLQQLLPSVDHAKLYEEEYPNFLSKTLEGHTFEARFGHEGEILDRLPTNVQTTMTEGLELFLKEVLERDKSVDHARRFTLQRELRDDLLEIGSEIVEEVQEAVYPYLQASPSSTVSVESIWTRSSAEGLVPMTVTYTLERVHTGNFRPAVLSAHEVSYTRQFTQNDSPRDKSWLVVLVSSTNILQFPPTLPSVNASGPALELSYLEAMLPPQIRNGRNITQGRISVNLEGTMVMGTETGVVLDGWTVLTTSAGIRLNDGETFKVSTHGVDRIRGQIKIINTHRSWP